MNMPNRVLPFLSDFLQGLRNQARIVRALMLRDMLVRYGRANIGFAWVVLEPIILTAGVMVLWSIMNPASKSGVKVVEFVLTGYMPLTLWRHLTGHAVLIFRRSAPLLYHNRITLFDIIFSRMLLEFVGTSIALLLVWGGLNLAGVVNDIANFDLLILGWLMMGWLAGAVALLFGAATEKYDVLERFIQPFQYLLIPICGAFAMVDWLPRWAQDAILLNPMVHCYEVFRAGYFGDSLVTYYSLPYFGAWAFLLTFLGILSIFHTRGHVQIS